MNKKGYSNFKIFWEGIGGMTGVIIFCALFLLLFVVRSCTTPRCDYPGCNEKCSKYSSFCYKHSEPIEEKPKKDYNTTTDEYEPPQKSDSYKPRRSYPPRSSNKSSDDPYNVNDYSDPEDFYDDNYDDFYDYEDAEDYYNEHYDE